MKNNKESCELFTVCLSNWLNNSKGHLSSILVDSIPTLVLQESNEDRVYQVVTYIKLIDLLTTVGWIEHTCDWDLGLQIILNDDSVIDTGHGYADIAVNQGVIDLNKTDDYKQPVSFDNLKLTFETENNPVTIELSKICTISLYR